MIGIIDKQWDIVRLILPWISTTEKEILAQNPPFSLFEPE